MDRQPPPWLPQQDLLAIISRGFPPCISVSRMRELLDRLVFTHRVRSSDLVDFIDRLGEDVFSYPRVESPDRLSESGLEYGCRVTFSRVVLSVSVWSTISQPSVSIASSAGRSLSAYSSTNYPTIRVGVWQCTYPWAGDCHCLWSTLNIYLIHTAAYPALGCPPRRGPRASLAHYSCYTRITLGVFILS